MTDLTPVASLDPVVQLETTDRALAGTGNPMNRQAQALLNRDAFRAQQIAANAADIAGLEQFDIDLQEDSGASLLGHRMRTAREQFDGMVFFPENFGDIGVSVAQDTAAIQAAIDFAYPINGAVHGTPGVNYQISVVRIKNGLREFDFSRSKITPDASTIGVTTGAIQLDGVNRLAGGPPVDNCYVSVEMDMVNGGRVGIMADGCTNCQLWKNKIYGFTNHASINHYGMLFWYGSNGNSVCLNEITGVSNPTQRGLLIDFVGESEAFAGYFANSGATVLATTPCLDNVIAGNTLTNGSYGVNLLGCENNLVSLNVCRSQNHRSIYLAEACARNVISNNQCLDFLSSAVVLNYGCVGNQVLGNQCRREIGVQAPGTGEAAINVFTGATDNLISHNKCYADTNYGIYMACNMLRNVVEHNEVANYYLAGIALESDWEDLVDKPAGALYSRPNFQTPGSVAPGATQWSFTNSERNTIRFNTIRAGAAGRSVAAIYVAQVNSNTNLSVLMNNIYGNEVFGNGDMAHYLYVFEETSGRCVNNKLAMQQFTDTSGVPSTSKIFLSRGRLHFNYMVNNDVIDYVVTTFADGDTTPTVQYGGSFAFANTAATSVTNFDDGVEGQEFLVRLGINTTLVHDNALLRLKGAVNVTGVSSTNFMSFVRKSGVWFELSRNF